MSEDLGAQHHPRSQGTNRYVYVVASRRSGGLSVGINLDPQKTCNFDCVYCEVVDRRALERKTPRPAIDPEEVAGELERELARLAADGDGAPRDVAFAGDGEPSTFRGFLPLARRLLDVRDASAFPSLPFVLITNGSGIDRDEMREAHDLFAARGGSFWVKLDAGTEPFYRAVCRTGVPFPRILSNLADAARRHPVVVQSMFCAVPGTAPDGPPAAEVSAWAARLASLLADGGRLAAVQVYTVARDPMELDVAPLSEERLEEIAAAARRALPGVPVDVFP